MTKRAKIFFTFLCLSVTGAAISPFLGKDQSPICGGVTDHTDKNAPKEIHSKNITEFETSFFAYDPFDDDKTGVFHVNIKPDESGAYVFTIRGVYSHEFPVSSDVLGAVQEIIDTHSLVKKNGGGRVTAGLPFEYMPWTVRALYDSGEKLYFYEDGAPEADWTTAFRNLFLALMVDAGCEDALPDLAGGECEDAIFD